MRGRVRVTVRGKYVRFSRTAIRVRVRCFFVTGGHKGGAVLTAALQKEEVEDWRLGCVAKLRVRVKVRIRVRVRLGVRPRAGTMCGCEVEARKYND